MYDFEVNAVIEDIIDKSLDREKTVYVLSYISNLMKEEGLSITDYRWQSLANHAAAMVARSRSGERIEGIEAELFSGVSRKSLDIAKAVTEQIGNLPENEMYLLSIHFETAHLE